jgi:hypothetical protein
MSNRNYGFFWVIVFRAENNRTGIPVPDKRVRSAHERVTKMPTHRQNLRSTVTGCQAWVGAP